MFSLLITIRHALDLEVQDKRLGLIKENKMTRRKQRAELVASKSQKKKKAESKSAKDSEKFRSMVIKAYLFIN